MKVKNVVIRGIICLFIVFYMIVSIFTINFEYKYRSNLINCYEELLESDFFANPNMKEFMGEELQVTLNKRYKYLTSSELLTCIYYFYTLDAFCNIILQVNKFIALQNGDDISIINAKVDSLKSGNFEVINEVFPSNSSYSILTPAIDEAKATSVLEENSLDKFRDLKKITTNFRTEINQIKMYTLFENMFLFMSNSIILISIFFIFRKKLFASFSTK